MSGCRLVGLVLCLVVASGTARANHHNRGNHVFAAVPCPPGSANTATSTGVAACSPPLPRSNCVADPGSALVLTRDSRFVTVPRGRTLTAPSNSTIDVVTKFQGVGFVDCDGSRFGGNLDAPLVLRVTAEDAACAGGRCTLPDFSLPYSVSCTNGVCRQKAFTKQGPPLPFATNRPWIGVIRGWDILDLDGGPFLSVGVMLGFSGGSDPVTFPFGGPNWEGRFAHAFAPCLPGTEDTMTTAGTPACSGVRPLSDCATDPTHAVDVEQPTGTIFGVRGKGKIELAADSSRTEAQIRHMRFAGLRTCTGDPYDGPLTLVAVVRATLADPACAGGYCTTVDTEVRLPVLVDRGEFRLKFVQFPLAATFRSVLSTAPLNAEVLSFELRDSADNAIMSGPAYLVRCDRNGNPSSCYGN